MSSTYTSRSKLAKPATNDTGWGTTLNADLDALDALEPVGGLLVTAKEQPSSTLNVAVAAGDYRKADGSVGSYAGTSSFATTTARTNYLYLTEGGTLTEVATAFPAGNIVRLAVVVSGATTITSVTDKRMAFSTSGVARTAARVASNVTINSTTMADVTGLAFAVGASEIWAFEFNLTITGNTNGLKFDLTGPTSPTSLMATFFGNTSGITAISTDNVTAFSTATTTVFAATAVANVLRVYGTLANGSTAGTVQLRAGTLSGTNSSTVRLNSHLVAHRIS